MNIIPAIDMKNGSCVRLFQGDFDQQTEYSKDPSAIAQKFEDMGFSQLHMVDLDGARSGEQKNQDSVGRIASETGFTLQLGGGIRDARTLAAWFDTGIDRCVIGSLAVTEADTVKSWFREFGPDRIVLALDVRLKDGNTPMLSTHGWTRESAISLWQCVDNYDSAGLKHVLCTDIGRDGALMGPNVALYREFVERHPEIHLQASGGVRHIGDLDDLRSVGASAAITGRALLDGRISHEEVSSFLRAA
jgi:phosphoribosylformimino-5-aminoimidazole carboxamide ribotide isomerase